MSGLKQAPTQASLFDPPAQQPPSLTVQPPSAPDPAKQELSSAAPVASESFASLEAFVAGRY